VLHRLLQPGTVVIPESARAERMSENLDVFDVTLTDEQITGSPRWTPGPAGRSTTPTPQVRT
jgi:diketogulonate reductase-like aldo/keto reductase